MLCRFREGAVSQRVFPLMVRMEGILELDTVLWALHSVPSQREFPQATTKIAKMMKLAEMFGFENTQMMSDFKYLQVLFPWVWLCRVTFQLDMTWQMSANLHIPTKLHINRSNKGGFLWGLKPTTDRKQRFRLWPISFILSKSYCILDQKQSLCVVKNLSSQLFRPFNLIQLCVELLLTTAVLVFSLFTADTVFQGTKSAAFFHWYIVIYVFYFYSINVLKMPGWYYSF